MQTKTTVLLLLFCCIKSSLELEYNKQRHNTNTDFLIHEAGGSSVWSNKASADNSENKQNGQEIQDYNEQFPSLGAPSTRATNSQSGKRDYVAPQRPNQNPQPAGNRDNVNTQQTNQNLGNKDSISSNTPTQKSQASGKRDYVAPQFTTVKPLQESLGNVKELVNFYDSKTKDQNGPQKRPSYSSIAQSHNQGSTVVTESITQPTPKVSSAHTSKPPSYSATVVNSNKPSTIPAYRPSQGNKSPTPKPILPSTLVNNNNQGNNNSPTDSELQTLSEELLRKDSNNAAKYITINYQEKTTSQSKEDKAPLALFTIAPEAWNIPTIQKLVPLLDNYERDTTINEYVTAQERTEENAFMDVIMNTAVIRHLMTFLKNKGYISPDPRQQRDFLKQLWFGLYSRGKGKISSSGFEHVFVSELKNGDVQGLHSWIYFSREELANRVNYLGYLKYLQLDDKGAVLKLHFSQQGVDKPVNSLFVGTSPELEIALYTLCFVTRADNECNLKLGTKDVNIVTHTFRYRSKNYIGSAYPQI